MSKRRKKQARKPLTDQQKRAAQLMFDGHPIGEVAAILGVHRSTIWRWRNRKDFQREFSRINDQYVREKRKQWLRDYHNSPEYKEKQRRKYAARQKLKRLEKRLAEAGNSGNVKEYKAACRAYDKCFSEAYLDGLSLDEIIRNITGNHTPKKRTKKPAQKPVKYIIEII